MLNAAKNKSLSPVSLAAVRVLLLLVVALCLGQTRVWGFEITPQPASGVFASVTPSSTGENYDGCPYDASDSLLAAKAAPPGGWCFPAGTEVSTPDGDKKIEDVGKGDTVFAYDFETKKVVERKVLETVKNFTHYWVDVRIADETIQATRGHQFWVESEQQWIEAAFLKPGMTVRLQGGRIAEIASAVVREVQDPETTYNLIVEEEHNYFVGDAEVLVHNGYPESPQYPPATKVGETFQFNFDTSPGYENSRAAGVARARAAGVLQPGEIGHHINSVKAYPHLAPEPSNIAPEASRASHLQTHGGNWRNPTTGPLRPGC